MARDYYEVLGVGRDAGPEELQQAYRGLARALHPDVNTDPGAEERFKEVNEAYHVLADPESRRRYDRSGPDFRQVADGAGAGPSWGRGPGRSRAAGPGGGPGVRAVDLGGIDLEDLFGSVFGARSRADPFGAAPREAEIELSVEEAYLGGRRHVTLVGESGPVGYDVTLPAGVVTGQRVRLTGRDGADDGDDPADGLHLTVRLAPHPRYRLDGRDISADLPVSPWEAALGATVPMRVPGGELTVRVPPGSSSGRRLRLRGAGMPRRRGAPGDFYAVVRVVVPSRLDDRERALFEQLAAASAFDPRAGS